MGTCKCGRKQEIIKPPEVEKEKNIKEYPKTENPTAL